MLTRMVSISWPRDLPALASQSAEITGMSQVFFFSSETLPFFLLTHDIQLVAKLVYLISMVSSFSPCPHPPESLPLLHALITSQLFFPKGLLLSPVTSTPSNPSHTSWWVQAFQIVCLLVIMLQPLLNSTAYKTKPKFINHTYKVSLSISLFTYLSHKYFLLFI